MSDEPIAPVAPAAGGPAPGPVAAPVVAPVVVEPAAPTVEPVAQEPAAAIEPVAEPVAPAESEAKPHTETESLLEEVAKKPDEPKPGEAKPVEPVAEPVAEPVVYDLKIPEGFQVKTDEMKQFTDYLGEKAIPPEVAQDLMDRHTTAFRQYAEHLAQQQHRVFGETRVGWRNEIMSDPEMGGAGFDTTRINVAKMRDQFASSAQPGTERYNKEIKEFNYFCRVTGSGDHPSLFRLLNNVARRFSEPSAPSTPFQPPKDIGRNPRAARGKGAMYDHPTSHKNRNS